MVPSFMTSIEQPPATRTPNVRRGSIARQVNLPKPLTFFLHREDSEPDRVALRNRLAPTQPFSSLSIACNRPTECQADRSFRSGPTTLATRATIAAPRCDLASLAPAYPVSTPRREQLGGRQADGFRRTIGFD